jgi:hypothetical protein
MRSAGVIATVLTGRGGRPVVRARARAGARATSLAGLAFTVVALTAPIALAAARVSVSPRDLAGTWSYQGEDRKGTVTFQADGRFEQSSQAPTPGTLKGRWQIERSSLIRVYEYPSAVRPSGAPSLTLDRVIEATHDGVVLRDQKGMLCTLSRVSATPAAAQESPSDDGALAHVVLRVVMAAVVSFLVYRRFLARKKSTPASLPVRPPASVRPPANPGRNATRPKAADSPKRPSGALTEAIAQAARHGMEMIQATGGPLRPFLMSWQGSERRQSNLMGESMADSIAMGKEVARESASEVDGCVLAWDGYVTMEGQRSDALFFQAYERGSSASQVLVQRYESAPMAHFRAAGNLTLIEQAEPLFTGGPDRPSDAWKAMSEPPVDVHNIVVKDPKTGRHQVHFTVTLDGLGQAKGLLLDLFDRVAPGLGADPDFGGQVFFVVYTPAIPGPQLAPELEDVRSALDAKIRQSRLRTGRGEPFHAHVLQKKSLL